MTLYLACQKLTDAVELLQAAQKTPQLRAQLLAEALRLIEDARRGIA